VLENFRLKYFARLEEELGTKLFERHASGVRLTHAGNLLLPYAEELQRTAGEAENTLAGLKGGASGQLALGASTTVAQYVLPSVLAEFLSSFPGIQLQVSNANTEHIAEGVAIGRFGLGLIEGPPFRRDLKIESWFDDELLRVVPSGHEWAGLGTFEPSKLYDVALVMRERGSGTRHIVEQGMQQAGLRLGALRIVMELDSTRQSFRAWKKDWAWGSSRNGPLHAARGCTPWQRFASAGPSCAAASLSFFPKVRNCKPLRPRCCASCKTAFRLRPPRDKRNLSLIIITRWTAPRCAAETGLWSRAEQADLFFRGDGGCAYRLAQPTARPIDRRRVRYDVPAPFRKSQPDLGEMAAAGVRRRAWFRYKSERGDARGPQWFPVHGNRDLRCHGAWFGPGPSLESAIESSILLTAGTAICGGSAIAALAPLIHPDDEDLAMALGTVFTLNSVALLIFPAIGLALHREFSASLHELFR